ncbi:hypothetical protein A6A04_00715 [Paramagnetospirillum marisnigri]|uniref:BON domain-containing protein n=1 Tax=Paramagnetospirillum marisnigri TaxID=1285242 RepID=A0A178MS94_9PROT|nr:BON domain-containing protein [Paramagnetospirillum marisnigri]OAN52250.1 hypothetical protein A6A04_00715 [Paramagnetospirillum marisnigri]
MTPSKPARLTAPLAVLVAALMLGGCGASDPGRPSPTTAVTLKTDSSGRVARPRAERNQDDSVGRAVLSALRQNDATAFKGVSALAWDGRVLLAGAVAKPEQLRRAEQLAKGIPGVATVFNDLVLDENPASPAFVPDVAREQKIYAGLLGQSDITGAYVVRVINGAATLMGSSTSRDDVVRAMAFAADMDGIKWVADRVLVP